MKFDKNLFNIVMQKFDLKKRERELNTIKLMEDLRDYRYYLSEILSIYPPIHDDCVDGWRSYYLNILNEWKNYRDEDLNKYDLYIKKKIIEADIHYSLDKYYLKNLFDSEVKKLEI